MYVQTTNSGFLFPGTVPYALGQILQIPEQYYNPTNMTRLGPGLTSAQQAVLIPMSTLCPGWTLPINAM